MSANFNGPIASLLVPAGSARLRIGNGCRARSQALSALSASAQLRLFHAEYVQYKQIKHGRAPRLGRSQHSAGCMYPARVCRAWACCWCGHQRGAKRRRQCKKHTELAKQQEVAVIDANNTDCYTQLEASLHLHALAKLQVQGWRPGAFEFQHLALTAARKQKQ